jgi:aspartate/methionine/tyrosine aminotransferase
MDETIVSVVGDMVRACPGAISLGQGVVHYGPPPEATEGVRRFQQNPLHKYGPVPGLPELLEGVKAKLQAENNVRTDLPGRRVMITAGANMGFVNALMSVADVGDEVVLFSPYYFNHKRAIAMAGCSLVCVPTDESYQIVPDRLLEAITSRTRAVVTVSPNNPSGAVYPESALREVNRICRERGIYHIHDEAYEYFTFDGASHFSPSSIPGSESHTISLYSFSKTYGMASWRVGYMAMPACLFDEMEKIQDVLVICPPVISQQAALGALQAGKAYWRPRVEEMGRVRSMVLEELSQIESICRVARTKGAFYLLLHVDTPLDQMTLVERLVREHGVGVIPGRCCGLEDGCYLRVSYGGLEGGTVAEGIGRLVKGLRALAKA